MGLKDTVRHALGLGAVAAQARDTKGRFAEAPPARRTAPLPSILSPYRGPFGNVASAMAAPRPTAETLRKFAATPVARRAINVVKDRISSMDWQVRVRRGYRAAEIERCDEKLLALRRSLEEPNGADSFRTLIESVLEDLLIGGCGAVEMRATNDPAQPFELFAVDGSRIEIDTAWNGEASSDDAAEKPHFGFRTGALGPDAVTPLLDRELMYVRLNPRTWTPFGLGRLEVAFDSISQLLSAGRYAGRLASNTVVQYALWLDEATPEQHDRLIRYWQDEIEGTGKVPVLSCEKKPEVLHFGSGTDADLRLAWQEFLIRMIANAFDLPPMLLGLQADVNRSTASEMADEAFQSAIVPVARLLAEHITRDVFAKCAGWREFEFVFNALETRDEQQEVAMQVQLLTAGVLTVDEVRAMRGLPPMSELATETAGQEGA